jgi:hypothetical protein
LVIEKNLVSNPIISFFDNWPITYSPIIECSKLIKYPNDTVIIYVGYQSYNAKHFHDRKKKQNKTKTKTKCTIIVQEPSLLVCKEVARLK